MIDQLRLFLVLFVASPCLCLHFLRASVLKSSLLPSRPHPPRNQYSNSYFSPTPVPPAPEAPVAELFEDWPTSACSFRPLVMSISTVAWVPVPEVACRAPT